MSKTTAKSTTKKTDQHDHNHDHHDHGHDHTHSHGPTVDTHSLAISPNSEIKVKIAWKTVEPVYNKFIQRTAQNVKAPGFRKGKVPAAMAEGMIDKAQLSEQVLQELLPEAYTEALKKENKIPISQPEIEPIKMEKGADWEFTIYFAERPVIDLKKVNYADAVKKTKKAADEEIKKAEKELADKADDKSESTPTTLSDNRKEDIRIKHIFKALIEAVEPKVPELLVRQEVNRELKRLIDQLDQFKLSVEDYLKSRQMTAEQLRAEYLGFSLSTLQIEFILAEIAKDQKLAPEEKEIDEVLNTISEGKLSKEQKADPEYRSYVFSTLTKQKVIKHLLSL